MTEAARVITCPMCGGCMLKIGRTSDKEPKLIPCPICGHGRVMSAPMEETVAVHRFEGGGRYTGRLEAPGERLKHLSW